MNNEKVENYISSKVVTKDIVDSVDKKIKNELNVI